MFLLLRLNSRHRGNLKSREAIAWLDL